MKEVTISELKFKNICVFDHNWLGSMRLDPFSDNLQITRFLVHTQVFSSINKKVID